MLETLRKSTGSLVVKILFGILILSFGVWGIGDMIRGGAGVQPAITVGDIEVGAPYVRQEFQRQVDRLRQIFGPELTADAARQMGLLDDTIANVASQATLDMAARDMGIVVTEDALRSAIMTQTAFQVGGTFSRDQFLRVLAANNMTEDRFLAGLRDDLRRARMVEPLAVNGAAPAIMADTLFRYRNEGRVAETLTIDASALTVDAQPSDEDLRAIYESSMDRYTAPQYRKITAVYLSSEDVLARAQVDETAIADHYEANRDLYTQPASRSVSQVIASDQDTAEAVAKAAQGGALLAEAAQTAGAPAPIDLGSVTPDALPQDMGDIVFALDAGQTSAPVESPLGWHVFQVTEVTPAQEQPLDAVRDAIRERITAEQSVDLLYQESANLTDALGGGATLEEAAEKMDLRLFKVDAVDIDGSTPAGTAATLPDTIGTQIVQTAFTLEDGQESLLQEADTGYFVVRVDDVVPAAPRPFEDVRVQVVAQWQATQRQRQAEALAETLAKEAAPPADLQSLASRSNAVTYARRPAATRSGDAGAEATGEPLDRTLVGRLFDMDVGQTAAVPTAQGAVVLRLAEVVPADPAANEAAVKDLRDRLRADTADDIVAQMTGAFSGRFGVEINRQAIDAAF